MADYVIPARIENGVKLLNLYFGNDRVRWQDNIVNSILDMSNGYLCIIGQTTGRNFLSVVSELVDYADDHSDFTVDPQYSHPTSVMCWLGFDHNYDESYTTLQTIWEEYLKWSQTEYRVWDENGDLIDSFRGRDADVLAQNSLNIQYESHKANGCEGCGVQSLHGISIQVCREDRDITGEMY